MDWQFWKSKKAPEQQTTAGTTGGTATGVTGNAAAPKKTGKPPSVGDYDNIIGEYAKIKNSSTKHSKKPETQDIDRKKDELDKQLTEADTSKLSADEKTALDNKKTTVMAESVSANQSVDEAVGKKNQLTADNEKNQKIVELVKHVGGLSEAPQAASPGTAPGTAQGTTPGTGTGTESSTTTQGTGAQTTREKNKERFEKGTGIASVIWSVVEGGIGLFNDTKDVIGDDSKAFQYLQKAVKGTETTKKRTDKASTGLAAGGAIVNVLLGAFQIGKGIVRCYKDKSKMDRQEKRQHARKMLGDVVGFVSSAADIAAAFLSAIPIVGPIISMAKAGLNILVAGIELGNSVVYGGQAIADRRALWEKMSLKKQQYEKQGDTESAGYFTFGNAVLEKKETKAEAKRMEILASVGRDMGEQGGMAPAKRHRTSIKSKEHGLSGVSDKLSGAILEEQKAFHQKAGGAHTQTEIDAHNRKMRKMEALQMLNEYKILSNTLDRNLKTVSSQTEAILSECVGLVGSGLQLIGQLTAATGYGAAVAGIGQGISFANSAISMGVGLAKSGVGKIKEKSQWGRNKTFKRNEMGLMLYGRMRALANENYLWLGDPQSIPSTAMDYQIEGAHDDLTFIRKYRETSDVTLSSLFKTTTKDGFVSSISDSFSQDGNF